MRRDKAEVPATDQSKRRALNERIVQKKVVEFQELFADLKEQLDEAAPNTAGQSDPRTLTIKSWLACYHQRFVRSGQNPVHVWAAITLCTDSNAGQIPLPRWCADYLHGIGTIVGALDEQLDSGDVPPLEEGRFARAAKEAVYAMGFTPGRGSNAFKRADSDRKRVRLACTFDALRSAGQSAGDAHAGAAKQFGLGDEKSGTGQDYAKQLSTEGKRQLRRHPRIPDR